MCEMTEPLLGYATTRNLLAELAARMELSQNTTKGRELGALCEEAMEKLAPFILDHRSIDP